MFSRRFVRFVVPHFSKRKPMPTSQYIYCVCQAGAETVLKQEVAARVPEMAFAFSRPGFVTFKLPAPVEVAKYELPRLTFARTIGFSFGHVTGETLADLAMQVWQHPQVQQLIAESPLGLLHVWQRENLLPGEDGFEPGPTALSQEVNDALRAAAAEGVLGDQPTGIALDIALVEPNNWWIGCHTLRTRVDRWPGGTPAIEMSGDAVSRAYLKMREALNWAALPAKAGELWVELGCAPGGASQALLQHGMKVLGVDPAEVDQLVLAEDNFTHLNMRAGDAKRKTFADVRWLAADINATPDYTLDAVEDIVTHETTNIRGLLLTLKLENWSLAAPEKITEYIQRIRKWGYRDVRLRQLAFNRRELCVAAVRSRGQRRLTRHKRSWQRPKKDAPPQNPHA